MLTKQAWSINNILYGQKENFFLAGPTREIPSGKHRPFLPAQVANQTGCKDNQFYSLPSGQAEASIY